MSDYYVGCSIFGNAIYAGVLMPDKSRWANMSNCTNDVLCAVGQYLIMNSCQATMKYGGTEYVLHVNKVGDADD